MKKQLTILGHFMSRPPVDVVGAILAFGIDYIEKDDMTEGQSGYLKKIKDGFEIGINAKDSPRKRRFTAAHELGHYLFHREMIQEGKHLDRLYGKAAKQDPEKPFYRVHEIQANQFAENFILPRDLVGATYVQNKSLLDVAKRFDVSEAAAKIRLKSLGLEC